MFEMNYTDFFDADDTIFVDANFTSHENRSDVDIVFQFTEFDPDSYIVTNPPVRRVPLIFVHTLLAQFVAGLFAFPTLLLSAWQIYRHLHHFSCPREQRWIVRLLCAIPVCTLDSWLGLLFFSNKTPCFYFSIIRDCFQAIALYSFLKLCYGYLGGECCTVVRIVRGPNRSKLYYFSCCLLGGRYSIGLLRCCKQAVLQFCSVKPVVAVLAFALRLCGLYREGDFSKERAYLCSTVVNCGSAFISLCALIWFYTAIRNLLPSRRPFLKFLAVASVVFLVYFQGVTLAALEWVGVIRPAYSRDGVTAFGRGEASWAYQSFAVCVEMFFLCLLFDVAFSHTKYIIGDIDDLTSVVVHSDVSGFAGMGRNAKVSMEERSHLEMLPEPSSCQENEARVRGQGVEHFGSRYLNDSPRTSYDGNYGIMASGADRQIALMSHGHQSMFLTGEKFKDRKVPKSILKVRFYEERRALLGSDDEMP